MGWFTHDEIGAWQRAEELCTMVRDIKSRHITKDERDKLDHAAKKAIKAANGLIRWLENNPDPN